jgi:hypothetical protein
MNQIKQQQVLDCLATGRYIVDSGEVFRLSKGELLPLKGCKLPTGYIQYTLFNGKRNGNGIRVIVYKHILCYLAAYGLYDEGLQIDHIDRDNTNCDYSNLRAVTPQVNVLNSQRRQAGDKIRTIRRDDIRDIKLLYHHGLSQSAIARVLNLHRLSVRYTIKRIESGEPLKYK